jgi:hypothetical protein
MFIFGVTNFEMKKYLLLAAFSFAKLFFFAATL